VRKLSLVVGSLGALGAACVHPRVDRADLSRDLAARTGRTLRADATTRAALPPGVNLADGLTEDETVALALWNNRAFQADLATLGIARADLIEAGMIRNPILTLLLPLGPKQLEFTASLPLEALWQRPRRVAAAERELERVGQSLVGSGLDVVRDAKLAYAEALRTRRRERLAVDARAVRGRLAGIAEGRLRAGDISPAEAGVARADAALAEVEAGRATNDRLLAWDRLTVITGSDEPLPAGLELAAAAEPRWQGEPGPLVAQALAARPDLRAAELAVEVAGARAGWERSRIVNQVAALADANGSGKEGFEIGPGLQIELPFFYQNQGARQRAQAELARAAWQYAAVRQRVVLEVRAAHREYTLARDGLALVRARVLPELAAALDRTEKAFAAGDIAHLFVLETSRQLIDARAREADLEAALRRAAAELDRSVGRKIVNAP